MRILVTGGAGFLGRILANRLQGLGHHVHVLDDLSAGDMSFLDQGVGFTRGDVRTKPTLWKQLQNIDCVYHLAARVSVPESILYPREYNAVNVGGTVALMEAMRDTGVKRVIFASSGAIYGEQNAARLSENLPAHPTSPYAVSKLSAEYYVRTIGQLWGIETVVLRIFNAYGPNQPVAATHPPVIPQFLRQVKGGGTLTIFGSGQQVRDFVYLDDVVQALLAAATAPDANGQIINIGSGVGVSINELLNTCVTLLQRRPQVLYINSESSGVSHLVADIGRAQHILNYVPQVQLAEGLRRTLNDDRRFQSD